jgi:hypothetical protein
VGEAAPCRDCHATRGARDRASTERLTVCVLFRMLFDRLSFSRDADGAIGALDKQLKGVLHRVRTTYLTNADPGLAISSV